MTILVSTDLHLTDKVKDAYRFGIFDFLARQREKHNASLILILGDLTDQKDKHSSKLVNAIVDGLKKLTSVQVIILMGNHDYYADPTNPFFKFLSNMHNITFLTEPKMMYDMLFLPHFHDREMWDNFTWDKRPRYAFIHQTVTGAISESGQRLDGFSLKPLKRLKCPVYGGDVHKPHTIEPVTYIGPPYHVRFGDNFDPRCVVLNEDTGETKDIHFKCPRKWSLKIRDPEELLNDKRLKPGDQVKVELELTREEVVEWAVLKKRLVDMLKDLELESFGIELKVDKSTKRKKEKQDGQAVKHRAPSEVLGSFCNYEKLPKAIRKAGLKLLG